MLTQTVTITQNSTPNIIIGRRSTYETQQVIFDVSWLIQTYGEGTAELLIKRPKDASAYPVVATLDGNTLTWTVSETDTQDKGHGECEIYWYVNGGLAKSCICGITILRDIGDTTETAPDPYETWVDELARLGSETLANAQAAEQSATSAAQSATEAGNSAAAALESEENALDSENAAKASEQAAAASAQGAEQSATAARQSATEAAQSASEAESSAANAQESAENSSASADRAEQAAASIEGDTERAEAAARTAQGAATSAQGSASTASTKATEASQSAATAGQAASTATQKAADASASATAAAGSATSASASATAAGNAQTAAETAQGKAEDAQEAAETAAQSIEDSAAQIDQNAEDILNLKSALNTKAGILRDTASGSVASFVPDATIPDLLGLDVALEPIQDLHGYDSPWPAGGGVNLLYKPQPKTQTINGVSWSLNEDGSVTANGTASGNSTFTYINASDGIGVELVGNFRYKNFPVVSQTIMAMGILVDKWVSIYPNFASNISDVNGKIHQLWFQIKDGQTADNITIYPMIYADGASVDAWTPFENLCPISGRDSVEVEAAGKNLFDPSGLSFIDCYGDDMLPEVRRGKRLNLPAGTYTLSAKSISGNIGYIYTNICNADGSLSAFDYAIGGQTEPTDRHYTLTDGQYLLIFDQQATSAANANKFEYYNIQIELGSTASEYKPYSGNTYTIQLGETVYGGTLDVTNGTLTVDWAMVDLGALEWIYDRAAVRFRGVLPATSSGGASNPDARTHCLCSIYKTSRLAYLDGNRTFMILCVSTDYVWLRDNRFTNAATFKSAMSGVQLCYELATSIVIDLDPVTISTISGQTNNVWADAGDVSAEFAADLKTYIDSKIAAAVAALS